MSPNPETETENVEPATTEVDESSADAAAETAAKETPPEPADGVEVSTPEFQSMAEGGTKNKQHEISRFADIKVTVSAELGRTSIPIEKLMTLGSGSVLSLDREIDSPIELIAQGVPLASGEVVVVDNCFAIRILEVYPRNRRGEELDVEK